MDSIHSVVSHGSSKYFAINLPVLPLNENGNIIIPEGTSRVMIDVGTSFNWPNSVGWLRRHPDDAVVMGFEPDMDMWCGAKCAHHFADNLWLLDGGSRTEYFAQEFTERVFFLPVAIGNYNGYSLFNINEGHGRSSILDSDKHNVKYKSLIPVLRLEEVIKRIPEYIEYIEHLKIDAQGYDFEVIKSAGETIEKCAVITVESGMDSYIGEFKTADMVRYIRSKGFREIKNTHRYGCKSYINRKYRRIKKKLDYEIRV